MSYFKILISIFVLWVIYNIVVICFGINKPCHGQYYEDNCYSDNVYDGYCSDTVIVEEYDVYEGYRGYSSYNNRSGIVDHYDVERRYSGYSTIDRRTGIIDNYDVGLGYTGYSQVYINR